MEHSGNTHTCNIRVVYSIELFVEKVITAIFNSSITVTFKVLLFGQVSYLCIVIFYLAGDNVFLRLTWRMIISSYAFSL